MEAIAAAGVKKVIVTSSVTSLFDLDRLWTDGVYGEKGHTLRSIRILAGILHRLIVLLTILQTGVLLHAKTLLSLVFIP